MVEIVWKWKVKENFCVNVERNGKVSLAKSRDFVVQILVLMVEYVTREMTITLAPVLLVFVVLLAQRKYVFQILVQMEELALKMVIHSDAFVILGILVIYVT